MVILLQLLELCTLFWKFERRFENPSPRRIHKGFPNIGRIFHIKISGRYCNQAWIFLHTMTLLNVKIVHFNFISSRFTSSSCFHQYIEYILLFSFWLFSLRLHRMIRWASRREMLNTCHRGHGTNASTI